MKKIQIDFQVYDSGDPHKIIILDTSVWSHIHEKPAIIEIIMPGETQPVVLNYAKNQTIILNSHNLGINCNDCGEDTTPLPDGVYTITVKGSPDKHKRKRLFLKNTTTRSDLDDLLIQSYEQCEGCEQGGSDIEKLVRYKNLLTVSEAYVRKGYLVDAQNILFKVQNSIKRRKSCPECPHKV